MYLAALFLAASLLASVAAAQHTADAQNPPGVEVLKFSWDKEVVGWEKDPFKRPILSYQDMQRQEAAQRRPGAHKTVDADETIRSHQKEPARDAYRYKVTVKNTGTRAIKAVGWVYVFLNSTADEVIGYHEFTSEEKLPSGKTKQLTILTLSPPAQAVNAGKPDDKELKALKGHVVIKRLEYEDGTVWELQ